jgi:hypothetical protein
LNRPRPRTCKIKRWRGSNRERGRRQDAEDEDWH